MKSLRTIMVALVGLVPAVALAHDAEVQDSHPPLHVDPYIKSCSVRFAPELTQGAFHRFVTEFGSVSAFKVSSPPVTLGRRGVEIGIEEFSFGVDEGSHAWNDTFYHPHADHPLGSNQAFPKVRLRAGVTDRLDLGAYYTVNPQANYGWFGLDAKYGLLKQSDTMPVSLAVRGAYTKTLYVDDMNMDAVTADVQAGRTYGRFTPYLGLGSDLVVARETSSAVALHSETMMVPRALGGLQVRWWRMALGGEVHVGALTSYQVDVASVF